MATRKIKDAKDLSTNELIYFKGHAKATYMSDGKTVEEAINEIGGGEDAIIFDFDKLEGDYIGAPLVISDDQMQLATGMSIADFMDKIAAGAPCYCKFYGMVSNWDTKICNDGALVIQWPGVEYKAILALEEGSLMVQVKSDTTITEDIVSQWGFTKNEGTVTKVKINGTEKAPDANGIVDLGTIEGGSGGSSSSGAYAEVNHGTSDTTLTLTPNTFHVWDEVASLTLTLGSETAVVANEFLFQFTSGSEATSLTLPGDIKWTDELVIEANRIYQVSILKGLASVLNWKVEPSIVFPITLEMGYNGNIGISLYSYLQSTYGEPTSGTTLNEEIINNNNGVTFETIEYATYAGFTGYWLNGYAPYRMSWVLLEDGYLQRILPAEES